MSRGPTTWLALNLRLFSYFCPETRISHSPEISRRLYVILDSDETKKHLVQICRIGIIYVGIYAKTALCTCQLGKSPVANRGDKDESITCLQLDFTVGASLL